MLTSKLSAGKLEALAVLNCQRLPARLNTAETAVLLGFQEHDIAPLMAAHLLAPLGKPAPNAPKYFAAVDVVSNAQDREWLSKATRALSKHWAARNRRKDAATLSMVKRDTPIA
jgi:hypothetical protein